MLQVAKTTCKTSLTETIRPPSYSLIESKARSGDKEVSSGRKSSAYYNIVIRIGRNALYRSRPHQGS